VKGGTVLGEWIFPESSLFLEQTLVIKAYRESTCHRKIAELEGELYEGQTGTTAVGFCSIRAEDWARARDKAGACKCTENPAERSSSVNSAAISDEYDFGEVRGLGPEIIHVVAVPLNPGEKSCNMKRLAINKDIEGRSKA
jgi:hypothetical protein